MSNKFWHETRLARHESRTTCLWTGAFQSWSLMTHELGRVCDYRANISTKLISAPHYAALSATLTLPPADKILTTGRRRFVFLLIHPNPYTIAPRVTVYYSLI